MSTSERPKQFIDVLGVGKTLLQLTYERFEGICLPENVWVVTNARYAGIVHEQLPQVPVGNILSEPCRRNTAPCIAYVSWKIKTINPKANVVVTPSDHVVTNGSEFRRIITSCLDFTSETDAIVTLGMKPTRPETGYGYIQADLSASSARNREIYRVDSFREKPDAQTAEKYIRNKSYFWNAGIFIWRVSTIVNAFRVYMPMPSWRRLPKYLSAHPTSAGATSAPGARCWHKPQRTFTAIQKSVPISRSSIRIIASYTPRRSERWWCKVSMDTSSRRKTTPYSSAVSPKNRK